MGADRETVRAPFFPDHPADAMKANQGQFVEPAGRTRNDAFATGSVLGAILLSALAGAFVVDVDPSMARADDVPMHYAAVEEAP